MASAQQLQAATATFSDKNKAAVDEMVKEAKKHVANISQASDKVIVGGAMMNAEKEVIKLYKKHNWAGKFTNGHSEQIMMGLPSMFMHEGQHYPTPPPNAQSMLYGSSGAVLYGNYVLVNGQPNNVGPVCGWLLAWSALDNHHRVYVNSGSLEEMMNLKWEKVKAKLDKSGTTSQHEDPETGAYASATITPDGNVAALGSVFGRQLLGS